MSAPTTLWPNGARIAIATTIMFETYMPGVAPKYSVQTSKMGDLAANPATKAIFLKYFPEVVNHPQFSEGLDLTLPEIVQYLPDVVTPEKLAAMDAELKAIP